MTSNRVRKLEDRARDARDTLDALLAPMTPNGRTTHLADLCRRAEQSSTIDGYPKGSSGERVSGGGPKTTVQNEAGDKESVPLTGVEATVIDRLEDICHRCERDPEMMPKCETCGGTGRRWADPIRDAVADLLEQLTTIAGASRRISKRYYQVYGTERKARQRQDDTQGNCDACGRVITGEESDRSKSGFCSGIAPSCWEKWRTYRRNHAHHDPVMLRRMFIAARRAELEAEKIPHDEVGRERELRKMGKAG